MKKKAIIALILIVAIIQFFQIEKTEFQKKNKQDFFAQENAPAKVKEIIQNNCYNCHSNQVQYPWYASISPVSWWLQSHIDEGREHLNFSEWRTYSKKKKAHKMEEAIAEVEEDEMPLPSYRLMHAEARLNPQEKAMLIEWFANLEKKYRRPI